MSEKGTVQPPESRGFLSKTTERLSQLLRAPKKEEPLPPPTPERKPERFSVLNRLRDSEKKDLLKLYASLASPTAHVIEVFLDEISQKEISIAEVGRLAPLFEQYLQERRSSPTKSNPEVLRSGIWEALAEERLRGSNRFKKTKKERSDDYDKITQISPLLTKHIHSTPSEFNDDLSVYMHSLQEAVAKKEQGFLDRYWVAITPEAVQKILELYPDTYEEVGRDYDLVFAKSKLLETEGLQEKIEALRDISLKFCPIDGADIQTPQKRLEYIELLRNPDPLRKKWKQEKPERPNKDWAKDFVTDTVLSELINQNAPVEQVIKRIHWFQIAGSWEQQTMCSLKEDVAGVYRKGNVVIKDGEGNETVCPPPDKTFVEDLMERFCKQMELFSQQIEAMKGTLDADSFEKRVHELACYALYEFVAIHPMYDGNGRTGRSLRDYIIAKHLGPEKLKQYTNPGSTDNPLTKVIRNTPGEIMREKLMDWGFDTNQPKTVDLPPGLDERRYRSLFSLFGEFDVQNQVFGDSLITNFARSVEKKMQQKK